jgi:hypothetical protein
MYAMPRAAHAARCMLLSAKFQPQHSRTIPEKETPTMPLAPEGSAAVLVMLLLMPIVMTIALAFLFLADLRTVARIAAMSLGLEPELATPPESSRRSS